MDNYDSKYHVYEALSEHYGVDCRIDGPFIYETGHVRIVIEIHDKAYYTTIRTLSLINESEMGAWLYTPPEHMESNDRLENMYNRVCEHIDNLEALMRLE